MKILITFLGGLICLFSLAIKSFGQDSTLKNNLVQTALDSTIALHNQAAGAQLRLYNGSIYEGYPFDFKSGHPYFNSKEADIGAVFHDGVLYKQVPIWYDLLSDKVIIEHYDESTQLNLVREKIGYFKLYDHTFVYLPPDSVVNSILSEGFYDQLFQGDITVMAKRKIKMEQRAQPSGIERTLQKQVRYYLKKNGKFYSFKSQRALINLLADKKKELQQYTKQNKLKHAEKENALVQIATYYQKLQN